MIYNKKEFYGGFALLVVFFVVLFFMFQPIFNGHNSMEYLDNLYNSISKGSVNYIDSVTEETNAFDSQQVTLSLTYESAVEAEQSKALFSATGATVSVMGKVLTVTGVLGTILKGSLSDAERMYHNDGAAITAKYSLDAERTMFNWWTSLSLMDKSLKGQREFDAAKVVVTVQKKAVEAAYNYYEVEPVLIMDKLGMVIFSLIFYVFYTLWYGFAILFLFEGWGLKLSH